MLNLYRKIRKRLADDNKPAKYMRYAIGEIVLVMVGILLALQVNIWNEERKNTLIEHDYLIEMLEDVENNLEKSDENIKRIEELLPAIIGLIEQSTGNKPKISLDSLNIAFSKINDMPAYSSTDRVYNNLVGSGDLKLIRNSELKTNLAEYYENLFILNLVQATHEMELVESFQPYIIENMDFQAVNPSWIDDFILPLPLKENRILEVLGDRDFRNILTLKWVILTDLLNQNRILREVTLKLVDNLNHL